MSPVPADGTGRSGRRHDTDDGGAGRWGSQRHGFHRRNAGSCHRVVGGGAIGAGAHLRRYAGGVPEIGRVPVIGCGMGRGRDRRLVDMVAIGGRRA